jgi:hypothetical protein
MKNRSRMAAKVTGIAAAGGLLLALVGPVSPAGAASQDVEYKLDSGTVTINVPAFDGQPPPCVSGPAKVVSLELPTATGLKGTWDDATGAFDADFISEEKPGVLVTDCPIPGNIELRTQFLAPDGVTGNIDPVTGAGTLSAAFDVNIFVARLVPTSGTPPEVVLNVSCTLSDVQVSYTAQATISDQSVIPTNISLNASGFTIPAAQCTGGPTPEILALITSSLNGVAGLNLPNSTTASALTLSAGAVPPPAPTTTTTTLPTTTTTTTTVDEAPAADAVTATVRFTG